MLFSGPWLAGFTDVPSGRREDVVDEVDSNCLVSDEVTLRIASGHL